MPRLGGSTRSSNYLVSVGSNTETLPVTAPNFPIVSDESPNKSLRKVPARAASYGFPRSRSDSTGSSLLPERVPAPDAAGTRSPMAKKSAYRAAERGRGNLLPTASYNATAPSAPVRSQSSSALKFSNLRRSGTSTDQIQGMAQSLRNRRSTGVLAEEEVSHPIVEDTPVCRNERGFNQTWSDSIGKADKRRHDDCRNSVSIAALLSIKRGQLLQALVMLAVTVFVLDSYYKAMATTEQLLMVKHDESMMMLHLKRLEEQAIHLHESVTRLTERGFDQPSQANAAGDKPEHVDTDLIRVQYDQLKQMEGELSHEVKALQTKIRQTDRANVVRAYGEGPVQVVLEIDFPAGVTGSSTIAILLWYETPHAAWTLLDQIRRGLWDGAQFAMDKTLTVVATPLDHEKDKRLDFIEKGQKQHEPWTVGLTEADNGDLSLFINLQDNSQYHKHDVCIGKIIDGFDTLQRLTRATRDQNSEEAITIRKATASHLKRQESDKFRTARS